MVDPVVKDAASDIWHQAANSEPHQPFYPAPQVDWRVFKNTLRSRFPDPVMSILVTRQQARQEESSKCSIFLSSKLLLIYLYFITKLATRKVNARSNILDDSTRNLI